MRKTNLSFILAVVCVGLIFAACAITDQNGDPTLLNYGLLAAAVLCGLGAKKLEGRYDGR